MILATRTRFALTTVLAVSVGIRTAETRPTTHYPKQTDLLIRIDW